MNVGELINGGILLFQCVSKGLAVVVASYLEESEHLVPQPSIRLSVNRLLEESNVQQAIKIINEASDLVLTLKC